MRKILLLNILFFVLSISALYSQTWERAYGFIPGKEEGAYTICKLTDGNFIVGGYGEDSTGHPARIIKITSSGDTLWSKRVICPNNQTTKIYAALSLSGGSFLTAGECFSSTSSGFVAKFDLNGNLIWIRSYLSNNINNLIYEIINANDGGFICLGKGYMLKIDENGYYKWHVSSQNFGLSNIYNITAFYNNYLLLGNDFPNNNFYISKIDNQGSLIWNKFLPNDVIPTNMFIYPDKIDVFGSVQESGTNYMITSLQICDTSGNFMYEKQINYKREELNDGFYLQISPNRYLLSSLTPFSAATDYCILRLLDTNLNIIKSLELTTHAGFRGLYSAIMQDSNYLLAAGNISLHFGYGYEDFYIIKTDTNLNMHVSIGIRKIENETPKEFSLIQNYPNPFNPSTKIKFSVPGQSKVNMSIYDITGKMVQTLINRNMQIGTYEVTWDASQLPSGTYFCKMTTEKFTKTIKLILLK